VAAGGELQGEKWVGLKPLFPTPAITVFHEVIAQGHMKEGANEKGASAQTLRFCRCEGEGRGYH
jgi:hypothetical protein